MFKTKKMEEIVLVDFWNSEIFKNNSELNKSSEIIGNKMSLKSDILSFGILLYEIITGENC